MPGYLSECALLCVCVCVISQTDLGRDSEVKKAVLGKERDSWWRVGGSTAQGEWNVQRHGLV